MSDHIHTIARCRPLSKKEKEQEQEVAVSMKGDVTTITHPTTSKTLDFETNHTFWSFDTESASATNIRVFGTLSPLVLTNALLGFNVGVLAMGQGGSGKSYTMFGSEKADAKDQEKGIVPYLIDQLYGRIKSSKGTDFMVELSMLDVTNDQVTDLLNPEANALGGLAVFTHNKLGTHVTNLSKLVVDGQSDMQRLLQQGRVYRALTAMQDNILPNRSHIVIKIHLTMQKEGDGDGDNILTSEITLVEMAGIEHSNTLMTEARREVEERPGHDSDDDDEQEGKQHSSLKERDRSLDSLSLVVDKLVKRAKTGKRIHIPYEKSTFTQLIRPCFAGDSKLVVIGTLSPSSETTALYASVATCRLMDKISMIKVRTL